MSFQPIHQSKSQNFQASSHTSQSAPRLFPVQEPKHPPTQEELENIAFQHDQFEGTRLQLKEKYGTITPVEQESLGRLQAKMGSFRAQRMERAKAQPNLLEILIRNAQPPRTAEPAPVQPKLGIGEPDDQSEQEADPLRVSQSARVAASSTPSIQTSPALAGQPQASFSCPDWFSHAPQRRPLTNPFQAKLTIGQPNDRYEQEADRVAEQVMRMAPPATPSIQRQAEEEVQTKPLVETITPIVQRQEALEEEPIQAKCEACGNELTAHELTHVVQQTGKIETFSEINQSDKQPLIRASSTSVQLTAERNYTPASKEFNHTRREEEAADIGQEALQTIGYEKIIEIALEAGFLREISSDESTTVQTKLQANQNTIFRQAQAATTLRQVFSRYAIAAGVASQVDSPVPGPGDVVAIGLIVAGLVAVGYNVISKPISESLMETVSRSRSREQTRVEPRAIPYPRQNRLVTLRLPSFKREYLGLYQGLVAERRLMHIKDRPARPTGQAGLWDRGIRSTIRRDVLEAGHQRGLSDERVFRPNWSKDQCNIPMEVDHKVELQVTPPGEENIWDSFVNYELLDKNSNSRCGSQLKANIAAERIRLAALTGNPTWLVRNLVFDEVVADGGASGERWTEDEITLGHQIDSFDGLDCH